MKNRDIRISKNINGDIPYLTEVLPMIPTNTIILYKKLTGLGATYGELKQNAIQSLSNRTSLLSVGSAKIRNIKMIICSVFLRVSILTI